MTLSKRGRCETGRVTLVGWVKVRWRRWERQGEARRGWERMRNGGSSCWVSGKQREAGDGSPEKRRVWRVDAIEEKENGMREKGRGKIRYMDRRKDNGIAKNGR